jgi:quercetin dioxygenase-like cupin family protein
MNLTELFTDDKPVQSKKMFSTTEGNVNSLRILAGNQLKEHITKVPALLVCVTGEVVFNTEKGVINPLKSGDYVEIEPMVKHWVDAQQDSYLLLIK